MRGKAQEDRDAYLLHQVHTVKLATDIAAALVSVVVMWKRRITAALAVAFVPAVLASAVVIRGDLAGLRNTRRGRYVLTHMPPAAQAVRLLGQTLVWWAAYRHRGGGIILGTLVVAGGWSFGLPERISSDRRPVRVCNRPEAQERQNFEADHCDA